MNISPTSSIYTYTMCLLVENGHSFSATRTFKVRLRCGSLSQYTITQPTELQSDVNVEEYIDSTGKTYSWTNEFTSTGDRLCPLESYIIYSTASNSISYRYRTGFTKPNDLTKTVTIADSVFASNLNSYSFYI